MEEIHGDLKTIQGHFLRLGQLYEISKYEPPVQLDIEKLRAFVEDGLLPSRLRVMINVPDATSLGFQMQCYGSLGCLVVADYIQRNRTLNYKCMYADRPGGRIFPGTDLHDISDLKSSIDVWMGGCFKDWNTRPKNNTFRRSLIVGIQTEFFDGSNTHTNEDAGHSIAIAAEFRNEIWTLFIFDYRCEEYSAAAHNQIWHLMANALEYYFGRDIRIRRELVCLKGKMHYGYEFMMCMSIAFRVCMYLSHVDDCALGIYESEQAFKSDSNHFKNQIFKMTNYLYSCKMLNKIPVRSRFTTTAAYDIEEGAYLTLIPEMELKNRYSRENQGNARHLAFSLESNIMSSRLVFDEQNGLKEVERIPLDLGMDE